MASFNRVILAGNITRDIELSYLPSNTAVCKFGLAINRKFRDKDGNQRDDVCYVDVNAFGKTAETIHKHFAKGRAILIEGRLQYREWTSQEGQKRSKLEVVVDSFAFIDSGQGGGNKPAQPKPAATSSSDDAPPPCDPDIPF